MKKGKLFLSAVVAFALLAFTSVQTVWNSDNAHSNFVFSITHMGISEIVGSFDDFSVTITGEKEDFSDAEIMATINVSSINTGIEMRDNHLNSGDFFDAESHPQITFKSTNIAAGEDGNYVLTGDLTVKGVTKSVELNLVHGGTIEHPQTEKLVAGFQASGTIKRSDFDIGAGFPAPMLSDEVAITINGQFQQ